MFLTKQQLKAAISQLDEARRHPDKIHHCAVPRVGSDGSTARLVVRPPKRTGEKLASFTIPHGAHDADFLQVDPVTGDIRCGACAGEVEATIPDAE